MLRFCVSDHSSGGGGGWAEILVIDPTLRMIILVDGWSCVQQDTFCPASLVIWQEENVAKLIQSREDQTHELGLFSPRTSSVEDPRHVSFLNVAGSQLAC